MWTGFSVISLYAYGKQIFSKMQNKVKPLKHLNVNKKISLINNKKSLENRFKKLMKVVKILNKKYQVTHNHNHMA